jgi:WD40 repeat protein
MRENIYRLMVLVLTIIAVSGQLTPYSELSAQVEHDYTISEVIAAYEAGQFRVIQTRSVWMHSSPDGSHVAASSDGVYRISDGAFFPQYDKAIFSPDGLYVAQQDDGVYRISDNHKLFEIGALPRFTDDSEYLAAEGYGVFRLSDGYKLFDIDDSDAYSDGYVYSFFSHFSPYGNYVVVDKDGVYRLSDQHKLFDIETEGLTVTFSSNEQYVASMGDGVYRLNDGQKLFNFIGATFSPNGEYVVNSGVMYRLSDGAKVLEIADNFNWMLSADGAYIAVATDGVYNTETGERLFRISSDNLVRFAFSPNGLYVAVSNDGLYGLSDGTKHFDITGFFPEFSPNAAFLMTSGSCFQSPGSVYRVSDGYRLFDLPCGATFSPDGLYAAVGTVGLYSLSDGQPLFEIEEVNTTFSDDGNYIIASSADSDSVYRVRDGYGYQGLQLLNIPAGIMAIGNTILVVDQSQNSQQLSFIRTDPHSNHVLYDEPDSEAESLRHINGGEYLAILDELEGWYQVGYSGKTGWIPADGVTRLVVPK